MIINEFYREREDGVKLYRTYSDAGMMIRQEQTGDMYVEAVDVDYAGYTYTETNIPVEEDTDSSDSEILDILLGREGEIDETEDH